MYNLAHNSIESEPQVSEALAVAASEPAVPASALRAAVRVSGGSEGSATARTLSRDQLYKIGLPGKLILRDYFQENMTSRRPFLLLRISFPGEPIFIQLPPVRQGARPARHPARHGRGRDGGGRHQVCGAGGPGHQEDD